ncbi:hypothetical protein BC628DRAFT_252239 [Trametes gibbosa]|nr:hypothetical protein BC628DRAFT_252239 [Trametes gibbosa]
MGIRRRHKDPALPNLAAAPRAISPGDQRRPCPPRWATRLRSLAMPQIVPQPVQTPGLLSPWGAFRPRPGSVHVGRQQACHRALRDGSFLALLLYRRLCHPKSRVHTLAANWLARACAWRDGRASDLARKASVDMGCVGERALLAFPASCAAPAEAIERQFYACAFPSRPSPAKRACPSPSFLCFCSLSSPRIAQAVGRNCTRMRSTLRACAQWRVHGHQLTAKARSARGPIGHAATLAPFVRVIMHHHPKTRLAIRERKRILLPPVRRTGDAAANWACALSDAVQHSPDGRTDVELPTLIRFAGRPRYLPCPLRASYWSLVPGVDSFCSHVAYRESGKLKSLRVLTTTNQHKRCKHRAVQTRAPPGSCSQYNRDDDIRDISPYPASPTSHAPPAVSVFTSRSSLLTTPPVARIRQHRDA